jgi:chromosome condensin MukBEF ATPase and DNA-binding subunit MukB
VERVEARSAELEQQLSEEQQRREEVERRLAEALAELERLRGGRS